jgi:hypothetical protein
MQLRLQIADVEYLIDINTTVHEFDSGGCSIGHRGGPPELEFGIMLVATVLAFRRSRRQVTPRMA